MSATLDALSTETPVTLPRTSHNKHCPICADSLFSAEGSALASDGELSYLWTCETCGYGFVTKHTMSAIACN